MQTEWILFFQTQLVEQDVTFLMSGAIIISMLLPCVPSLVAPYLGDILEIFIQMATYLVYKPGRECLNLLFDSMFTADNILIFIVMRIITHCNN